MQKNKVGLLLAALAAYGAYKYTKMSAEEKNSIKEKGRDFFNKNLGGLKDLFGTTKTTTTNGGSF